MVSLYFGTYKIDWNEELFRETIRRATPVRIFIEGDSLANRIMDRWRLRPRMGMGGTRLHGLDLSRLGRHRLNNTVYLIHFERLEEEFEEVCKMLKIPYVALSGRNKSKHDHYRCYYDQSLKKLVEKKFCHEIEWGQYSF